MCGPRGARLQPLANKWHWVLTMTMSQRRGARCHPERPSTWPSWSASGRPSKPGRYMLRLPAVPDSAAPCGVVIVSRLVPGLVSLRRQKGLVARLGVLGRQPGQLRVDLADHRPDGGDPCLQDRGVRALTVGVELVDGLSHAPECRLIHRTHHRRLSGRQYPRARFRLPGYPQLTGPRLWINPVGSAAGKSPPGFSSTHPVDHVSPVHAGISRVRPTVSTVLSPGC